MNILYSTYIVHVVLRLYYSLPPLPPLSLSLSLSLLVMNACNAALRSDKLYAMASRTRKQYLNDIVKEHTSSVSLEQVGGGALGEESIHVPTLVLYSVHVQCNVSLTTEVMYM